MTLNKFLMGIILSAVLVLFCGCASTDDSVKEVVFDSGETAVVENASEDQDVTAGAAALVETDTASSYQVEATAPAGKDNKKNYTGWIATSMKPVSNEVGNIKLLAYPKKGTFAISALNQNGKAVAILSSANEYKSTSFYLKAGHKIIKLSDDSNVVTAAKKTDKGIKIRYTVDKVAIVLIEFTCFSSVEGEPEDSVRVTAAVVSQAKKKTDFSLKLVMDTVLGETDRHHFYTHDNLPVKNEVLYRAMEIEEHPWFTSKNSKGQMQIILCGGAATPVESFALANYATLDTKKWEADMNTFRSFDTVLSYNNSAFAIYWPKAALQNQEQSVNVFYLSTATDGEVPGGAALLLGSKEEKEKAREEKVAAGSKKENQQTAVQNIEAVKEPEPQKTEPAETPSVNEPEPSAPKEAEPQNVSAVDEDKPAGPAFDRLSIDYIQRLLDRIDELSENDPELNKDEINALNTELDEIISILNEGNE